MEFKRVHSNLYGELSLKICQSDALRRKAFALRYTAYLSQSAIEPNDQRSFSDRFDELSNSTSYLLEHPDSLIGSIRACTYSGNFGLKQIPSLDAYSADIQSEIGLDKVIVESCRFVVNPDIKKSFGPQLHLFRMILLNAFMHDAEFIITAVREKHIRFYRDLLNFSPISSVKTYPGLNAGMVLLATNFRDAYRSVTNKIPELQITDEEVQEYKECIKKQF